MRWPLSGKMVDMEYWDAYDKDMHKVEGVTVVLVPPRKGCKEVAETLADLHPQEKGLSMALYFAQCVTNV